MGSRITTVEKTYFQRGDDNPIMFSTTSEEPVKNEAENVPHQQRVTIVGDTKVETHLETTGLSILANKSKTNIYIKVKEVLCFYIPPKCSIRFYTKDINGLTFSADSEATLSVSVFPR